MLYEILIAAFDLGFNIFHQNVKHRGLSITTYLIPIIFSLAEPMAIIESGGIFLSDASLDCNLYFFNGIEYKIAQSAVETIEVDNVREMYIGPYKLMVCIRIRVVLKRIGISSETIVADI